MGDIADIVGPRHCECWILGCCPDSDIAPLGRLVNPAARMSVQDVVHVSSIAIIICVRYAIADAVKVDALRGWMCV